MACATGANSTWPGLSNINDTNKAISKIKEISKVLEFIVLHQKQYTSGRRSVLTVSLKEDLKLSSDTTICFNIEIEGDGEWTQYFSVEQLFTGEIQPLLSGLMDTVGTFEFDIRDHKENQMKHANVSIEDGDNIAIKFSRSDCHGSGKDFHCKYLVVVARDIMLKMLTELKSYLHSVFLLNNLPLIELTIEATGHSETKIFGREARSRVSTCGKRLVADICYFTSVVANEMADQARICYKTSPKSLITSPVLSTEEQTSLKLFVTAATIPSQRPTAKLLNIYLFGPDGIPLVLPGISQCSVLPCQLAKWEEFGLQVGQQLERHHSNYGLVLPDQSYHLIRTSDAACPDDWQILQLIMLIDFDTHHSILEKKEILETVRLNLSSVVTKQVDKFKKATHKALNKLWLNKSKSRDKQKIVEEAIPVAVNAIRTIIKYSTNEDFRKRCFDKLKVSNSRELSTEMTTRLWNIASKKFHVVQPGTVNPSTEPQANTSTLTSAPTSSQQSQSNDVTSFDEFGDLGLLVCDDIMSDMLSTSATIPENSNIQESETSMNDDWFSQALTECDWLNVPGHEE